MRIISSDAPAESPHDDTLTLPFDLRQKSRLLARLDSGEEVGLMLARGRVLRGGDRLLASDTRVVLVQAQAEEVSTVRSEDAHALARAAYHLGNRHIPVQIGDGWLRYLHDHVLDDMVRALDLSVVLDRAPFEPEAGAYGHGHSHSREHSSDVETGAPASSSSVHASSRPQVHSAHLSHSHAHLTHSHFTEADPSAKAPSDRRGTHEHG
jgi:urease accessory protein